MSNILLVPVSLDAFCVSTPQEGEVRPAMADYSKLPYLSKQDGTPVQHPPEGKPNLSEEILSQPMTDSKLELSAGVHLHWALPDALTESTHSEDNGTRKFPIVPNRWFVRRYRSGIIEKKWVVESDYLYPEQSDLHGTTPNAVTIPFPKNNPFEGHYQPFRYLGRSQSLEHWQLTDSSAEYLTNHELALTVLGAFEWETTEHYGRVSSIDEVKATFAAFYPNSYSVFGFCDTDINVNNLQDVEYEVISWYSDKSQDYLNAWYTQYPHQDDRDQLQEDFLDRFQWQFDLGTDQDWPTRTICYGKLKFDNGLQENPAARNPEVSLALGNTGTEALSAYLAQEIDSANKVKVEEQLEALHLKHGLVSEKLDLGAKFKEARHSKGFSAFGGGWLWSVRKAKSGSDDTKQDTNQEVTLPEHMAHQLAQLNLMQREYDRAWEEIDSLGDRLFNDWYKWMVVRHPNGINDRLYLNITNAFLTIVYSGIVTLRQQIAKTGQIQWQKNSSGQLTGSAVDVEFAVVSRYDYYYNNYRTELQGGRLPTGSNGLWKQEIENCGLEPLSGGNSVREVVPGLEWEITNPIPDNRDHIYNVKVKNGKMNLSIPSFSSQKSHQLLQAIDDFNEELGEFNQQQAANSKNKELEYVLKVIPYQGYWQPQDPSLLITGETVQPSRRYGNDGTLDCPVITKISDDDIASLPHRQNLLDEIKEKAESIPQNEWTRQPWHPFMLEWEVEFFPNPKDGETYTTSQGDSITNYEADFITKNYELKKNAVDLVSTSDKFETNAKIYAGFSILSPPC